MSIFAAICRTATASTPFSLNNSRAPPRAQDFFFRADVFRRRRRRVGIVVQRRRYGVCRSGKKRKKRKEGKKEKRSTERKHGYRAEKKSGKRKIAFSQSSGESISITTPASSVSKKTRLSRCDCASDCTSDCAPFSP